MTPEARARSTSPSAALLDTMTELWEASRFREAAKIYDAHPGANPPLSATVYRARAYLKEDEAPDAIAILQRAKSARGLPEGRRLMVLAEAHAQVGNYTVAEALFDDALRIADRFADAELAADVAYYRALRYIFERRPEAAREMLPQARKLTTEFGQLRALHLEGHSQP